jgi:hypothetical protein
LSSGIGIDDADKKKGITTMPAKLENMCPSYELWDQWFGSKQKFNPSDVQTNARVFEEEDVDGQNRLGMPDPTDVAFPSDGGADAQLDELGVEDVGDENIGNDESGRQDGVVDNNGDGVTGVQGSSSNSSVQSPRGGVPRSSPHASPNGHQSPRSAVAPGQRQQQVQLATAEAQAAQAAVAAAVSTSPSTAAKADKFDATYSAVQHRKIEMQHTIEQSRCANAILLQSRDQKFQARLISAQQQCKDQDAEAERRLRQRISYETNMTQLLVKDASGALANDFDRRIQAQQDREDRRLQSQNSSGRDMLAMLLQGGPD